MSLSALWGCGSAASYRHLTAAAPPDPMLPSPLRAAVATQASAPSVPRTPAIAPRVAPRVAAIATPRTAAAAATTAAVAVAPAGVVGTCTGKRKRYPSRYHHSATVLQQRGHVIAAAAADTAVAAAATAVRVHATTAVGNCCSTDRSSSSTTNARHGDAGGMNAHPGNPIDSREAGAADAEVRQQDAVLRRWISDNGGFVHDAISIARSAECGARGLVASAAISLRQLERRSLVALPRGLHLDNGAAVRRVAPRLAGGGRRLAFEQQLGQLQQVACCLASERTLGADSFWHPYLRTLPATPPNPWLLTDQELALALQQAADTANTAVVAAAAATTAAAAAAATAAAAALELEEEYALADGSERRKMTSTSCSPAVAAVGAVVSEGAAAAAAVGRWVALAEPIAGGGWAAAVAAARRRYGGMAEEILEVVGADAGSLGLDREGLMWALGQVVSRSLGSGRSSGLLPYIDMANHHAAARPPMMLLIDPEEEEEAALQQQEQEAEEEAQQQQQEREEAQRKGVEGQQGGGSSRRVSAAAGGGECGGRGEQVVFAVTSIRCGELAPLSAGQELFISYQAEDLSPLQAWLKWGFVPDCRPAPGGR